MQTQYVLTDIEDSINVERCRMDDLLDREGLPDDPRERAKFHAEAHLVRLLMQRRRAARDRETEARLLDPATWASAVGSMVELREKLDLTDFPDDSFGAALKCRLAEADPRRRRDCRTDGRDHSHTMVTAHWDSSLSRCGADGVPSSEFFVDWHGDPRSHLHALESALRSATREQDLQALLEARPRLLINHLRGGHGRWVIPRQRLGAQHVTDFVVGERCSYGFEWCAVELESPLAQMFTKAGDPSKPLSHAIRQITDWRAWLQRNHSYATLDKAKGGLGLTDIVSRVPGLILIGRREHCDRATDERRRQMIHDLGIQIRSYDFLLDSARGQVAEPHGGERT